MTIGLEGGKAGRVLEAYLAAHDGKLASKLGFAILKKVLGDIKAVFRALGEGMLRRQTVANRNDDHVCAVGHELEVRILAVSGQQQRISSQLIVTWNIQLLIHKHPPAAVDVHDYALDLPALCGHEHAARNLSAAFA